MLRDVPCLPVYVCTCLLVYLFPFSPQHRAQRPNRQQGEGEEEQERAQRPREGGGEDGASMLAMEGRPRAEFGLVGGFHALFAVPPGAAAIEIGSNFGGADGSHEGILSHLRVSVL